MNVLSNRFQKFKSNTNHGTLCQNVNELIAAEGNDHLKCYTKFLRKTDKNAADSREVNSDHRVAGFEEIMSSIEKGLSLGPSYSLKAVWTSLSHQLESH